MSEWKYKRCECCICQEELFKEWVFDWQKKTKYDGQKSVFQFERQKDFRLAPWQILMCLYLKNKKQTEETEQKKERILQNNKHCQTFLKKKDDCSYVSVTIHSVPKTMCFKQTIAVTPKSKGYTKTSMLHDVVITTCWCRPVVITIWWHQPVMVSLWCCNDVVEENKNCVNNWISVNIPTKSHCLVKSKQFNFKPILTHKYWRA